jgi:hypothetical protein
VRVIVAVGIGIPVAALALPGRPFSRAALRKSSVDVLRSFEGTRYVWGGEARLGIDCSGLVRQALIRASLKQGLASLNGDLVRGAAKLWWFDSSARALRDGYRGETIRLLKASSVNAAPIEQLLAGDFAVTSDGIHVLAYLGGHRWIEADPEIGRVVTVETPNSYPWFAVPVHIVRWRALTDEAKRRTALAWMRAIEDGDRPLLERSTTASFTFRSTGADRSCEGRIAGAAALAKWLACLRAREDIRGFLMSARLYREGLREDPTAYTEFVDYLPRIVDAPDESEGEGGRITIMMSWLYTVMNVRLQLVGTPAGPRVQEALLDVQHFSD